MLLTPERAARKASSRIGRIPRLVEKALNPRRVDGAGVRRYLRRRRQRDKRERNPWDQLRDATKAKIAARRKRHHDILRIDGSSVSTTKR